MRLPKTAYELARSQVATPPEIVDVFWQVTSRYRKQLSSVLDLGAGDCRFARGGRFTAYHGIEIDATKRPCAGLPATATLHHGCAFEYPDSGYSACIGNPPYVRHHDLDEVWRDRIAARLSDLTGHPINRKCNLYVYFLMLALLKAKSNGLVSMLVPYEWVSRPSAKSLRDFIADNEWHVDTYRFTEPIFDCVLTTASITVIDKRNRDGKWTYHQVSRKGETSALQNATGSDKDVLSYEDRGKLWAMRGMSPGTQKVFTLTEGERIHAGLRHDDVLPCVTSLRKLPCNLSNLTLAAFRKRFVDAGERCWLIKSHTAPISARLQAYLDSVPTSRRDTWTCTSRELWYRYSLFPVPRLLISTGFTEFGPKVVVNSVRAHAVGSVCGVYSDGVHVWRSVREYLAGINFEKRVVAHAKILKKIEIRQLNSALNAYDSERELDHA